MASHRNTNPAQGWHKRTQHDKLADLSFLSKFIGWITRARPEGQMEVRLALKAASFIALSVVGIPGNLAALLLFCHLFVELRHMGHNEIILCQLIFANLVVTLCRCIPQAMTALGIDLRFDDHACKAILYAYRVGRGMSLTLTSLLSSYQCVIIAPPTPGWNWLKRWLPGHLPHAIIFLYGLNMTIYVFSPLLNAEGFPANGTIPEYTLNLKFCIVVFPEYTYYIVNGMVNIIRDFIFVALMAAAAVYMMLVLHRHRQQVQGLQGAGRKTEEASRAVLLLVSTYVLLFSLDNVLFFYTLSMSQAHPTVSDARVFFATCYSTISPVLIIATNKKLSMYFNCGSKCKSARKMQSSSEYKVSRVTSRQ